MDQETEKVVSAGILCYAVAETTGDIYFLLGRESVPPSETTATAKKNSGGNRWSDFGGGVKLFEDEIDAAAREFVEESMGVIHLPGCARHSEFQSNASVAEMLRNKDYTCRVALVVPRFPYETEAGTAVRVRVCYLKRIPWQPDLPEHFQTLREMLDHLAYYSEIDMHRALMYYETLPPYVQKHPAIRHVPGQMVQIKNEYREKTQIGWWSLQRLQVILRNNGVYRNKYCFRVGCLATLSVIINEIMQHCMHDEKAGVGRPRTVVRLDQTSSLQDTDEQESSSP